MSAGSKRGVAIANVVADERRVAPAAARRDDAARASDAGRPRSGPAAARRRPRRLAAARRRGRRTSRRGAGSPPPWSRRARCGRTSSAWSRCSCTTASSRSGPRRSTARPAQLRKELERLAREGYVPITAAEYVDRPDRHPGRDAPGRAHLRRRHARPLRPRRAGQPHPDTAVGVLLDVARRYPGFRPVATFWVNRDPFGLTDPDAQAAAVGWLVRNGFEVANHTYRHADLRRLPRKQDRQGDRPAGAAAEAARRAAVGHVRPAVRQPAASEEPQRRDRGSWERHTL